MRPVPPFYDERSGAVYAVYRSPLRTHESAKNILAAYSKHRGVLPATNGNYDTRHARVGRMRPGLPRARSELALRITRKTRQKYNAK